MTNLTAHARRIRGVAAGAILLLLAACLFAPGKFTSQLDLHRDRSFTFRYTGEILLLPLVEAEKQAPFEPSSCYEESSMDERACSAEELEGQKLEWDKRQKDKRESDAMAAKALLGGIDPSDPQAGKELAARLQRQAGWNRVEYMGQGRFDVDVAITSKLDRDFVFPTIEGFTMNNPFVQVFARRDGTVRIEAPAFGPDAGPSAMEGLMSGMAKAKEDKGHPAQDADGTFRIETNGEVLANNTDEGPTISTRTNPKGWQALSWKVNARSRAAPTALVRLAP